MLVVKSGVECGMCSWPLSHKTACIVGVISIQSLNVVVHIICNILYELVNEVGYVSAMGKGSTLFKFLHLLVRAAKPKMMQRINKKA